MNYHQFFGILAPVVSLLAFIPYLRSILKGKTKPSAASWWTWTILIFVVLASSWASGASWQVLLLPAWLCVSQLVVAILALKYGNNDWDRRNKLCVVIAIFSIALWLATGNALLALALSIVADLFASIPNFRHIFLNPEQEDKVAWLLGWLSALMEILAVASWNFASSAWAIYFILNMSVILCLLFWKRQKNINVI